MNNKHKKTTNKILWTTCVVTIFLAMFNMGSSEEKRSLLDLQIDDTVSTEEYRVLLKEQFKEYSLCSCIDHGITGYDYKLEDGFRIVFSLTDEYDREYTILDSCAKVVADSIPFLEYLLEEEGIKRRLISQNCLDYYHSDKLDSLVNQLIEESKELNNAK